MTFAKVSKTQVPLVGTKAQAIRVEGHALQGDGCSQRNLIQLLRVMMLHPRFVAVADFLLQAMKRRRQFRQNLYTGPLQ